MLNGGLMVSKRLPMHGSLYTLLFLVPTFLVLAIILPSGPTYAETIDTNVNIEPSLTVTIPSAPLNLTLDPSSTTFGTNNLTVRVGTNNPTGYKMTMTTANDNTDLVDTTDSTKVLHTLASGTYTDATFTTNKWGYKKGSGNYVPFVSGATVLENDTVANGDTTTLTFATKIDYLQPAGAYSTTLNFATVVYPTYPYMQDFTKAMCQEQASSAAIILQDKRDHNDYTVRYINGNCWMTQNLRLGYNANNPSTTTLYLDSATSNIESTYTAQNPLILTLYDAIEYGSTNCWGEYSNGANGDGYTNLCMHSGTDSNSNPVSWYNYAATSARTVIGVNNSATLSHDICPAGWKIPDQSTITGVFSNSSYTSAFNPVYSGAIANGSLINVATRSEWWSSEANDGFSRLFVRYDSGNMSTDSGVRYVARSLRCILK